MKTPLRVLGLTAAAASIALGATACGGGYIHFNQVPDAEEEAHTAARFPATPAPATDHAAAAAGEIAAARAVLARPAAAGTPAPASDPALRDPAAWPALGHEGLCRFVARTVTRAADSGSAISGTVRGAAQKVLAGC